MATKVFSTADYNFTASSGFTGVDIIGAAAQIVALEGTAAWTQTTNVDTGGTVVQLLVEGTLIDDASVPPVITMTNVHVAYDWSLAIGAGVTTPSDSFIGEDMLSTNTPPIVQTLGAPGSSSGHASDDMDDFATYFGGTSRAALFAKPLAWAYGHGWTNPFVAHTNGVSFTNYVITVTYTTPVVPAVISVNPPRGSINGGQAVTIHGHGFTGAPGALFGGVAVTSFVVVDDDTATAVTPAHLSGLVDVEVTGVGTGVGLYTYVVETRIVPPMPTRTPIAQGRPQRG